MITVKLDWDTFYFDYWLDSHDYGDEPTHEDYLQWLFGLAELYREN